MHCTPTYPSIRPRRGWAAGPGDIRTAACLHTRTPLIDGLGHATWSALVLVSRSRTRYLEQNACFFRALVALKLLVSFIPRLVACSARRVQTDQTKYCNPRCACRRAEGISARETHVATSNCACALYVMRGRISFSHD